MLAGYLIARVRFSSFGREILVFEETLPGGHVGAAIALVMREKEPLS